MKVKKNHRKQSSLGEAGPSIQMKYNVSSNKADESTSSSKKPYVSAYKRAQLVYERIQQDKKHAAEQRRIEMAKREEALLNYMSTKKKMDKALKKRTKKGQPKLGAQVEVLLEKIQKRMSK
uniref:Thyroid transcription factor 1-associated protein 26 n=1 Tax=Acrobeloides nanus TaxID=290746 RepID=A0A914BVY3_9BILA